MELTAFLKLATEKAISKNKEVGTEEDMFYKTIKKLSDGFDHNIKKEMAYIIYDEYKDSIPHQKWADYFFDLYRYAEPSKKAVAQFEKFHEYLKDNKAYQKYILEKAPSFKSFLNKEYLQENIQKYNEQKEVIDFMLKELKSFQFDSILTGTIEENAKKINSLKGDLVKGISSYTYDDYLEINRLFRQKVDDAIEQRKSSWLDPKFNESILYVARDIAHHPIPNYPIQETLDILRISPKDVYNSGNFWFSRFIEEVKINHLQYWDNATEHDYNKKTSMFLSFSNATNIKVGVNYRIAGALLNLFGRDAEKAYYICNYFEEQIQHYLGLDIKEKRDSGFMVLYDYIQLKKGKTTKIQFTQESFKNFTMVYEKVKFENLLKEAPADKNISQHIEAPKKKQKI